MSYSFPWASGGGATFSAPAGAGYSATNEQNAAYHYGFNATQQTAARAALQSWANVANIGLQEVADTASNVGDIRFAFSSAVGSLPWGYSYYPNSYWPSAGDIWISTVNSGATDPNWSAGSYNYYSLIHEVGHALGLKHPFEGAVLLPTSLDTRQYSVMSYTDPAKGLFRTIIHNPDGSITLQYDEVPAETPMVLDIAAIQYLYGANMTYRTGDDVYSFDPTRPFYKTIWDAGGNDTISVSNFTENCRIDLTPGNYSSIRILSAPIPAGYTITGGTTPTYDGTHNLGIAYGAIIENATGGSGADTLIGNNANNRLNGGAGADQMTGGLGNDTYVVDNAADATTETSALATEIDTVQSSVTRTLGANLEKLSLTGAAAINGSGNALNNTLTGNAAANTLNGGAGNDVLNGGAGIDTMIGGLGNDTYVVDNAADVATETSTLATEIDTVQSSVTRTLGANLEKLSLTGAAAINGSGNALNNTLTGNAAANTLNGGAGNDVLNGGAGIDTMIGGLGNDTYVVDNAADVTTETSTLATEIDTVQSSVTRTLGANLEKLSLTGAAAINGSGNALNNTLNGNAAANTLNGGTGADQMVGGLGNDTYVVDNAADVTTETSTLATEIDTVQSSVTRALGANLEKLSLTGAAAINGTGNALNNTLIGNAAANTLNGGAGNDVLTGGAGQDSLTGGAGSDIFDFNAIADSVIGANRDVITDFVCGADKIDLSGIDANTLLAGDQAFTLIAGGAAFSAAGQVKCTSSGILYCNVNGDTVSDFQIALTGMTAVTQADFVL